MIKYIIDTNLLVYAYDISEPEKRARALDIMDRIIASGAGMLSTQILAEFFVAVTRKINIPLSNNEATDRVRKLAAIFPVVDMTAQTVIEACQATETYSLHYYDAQILSTASLNDIPVILSEDWSDRARYGSVQAINPFAPEFRIETL